MTPASYDEGLKVLKMEDDETHHHHGGRAGSPENSSLWGRGRVRSAGDLDVICASTYYIFATFSHLRHCLVLFFLVRSTYSFVSSIFVNDMLFFDMFYNKLL